MSTNIVYHMLGAVGYKFISTTMEKQKIGFLVQSTTNKYCPVCGSTNVILKGSRKRWLKALPAGPYRSVFLVVIIRRFFCKNCKSHAQEPVTLISSQKLHYTKRFERFACNLLEFATVKDVADYCGISWDTIKEIDKRRLKRNKPKWRYKDLVYIAIDEICLGRLMKYKTIVYDLQSGHIIKVIDGRGGEAVARFFRKLRTYATNLKAIAMDMSRAYWGKALEYLPDVDIVFDRFHVVKLMNKRIDNLRRECMRNCEKGKCKVMNGKRWLLLMGEENLDDKQRKRLDKLLALNTPLTTAYILKEELRRLWDEPDFESGERFLVAWCCKADVSGIGEMRKMAKTLRMHKVGILNYFKHRITSGPLEGVNNKIKAMLRRHYGLRDPQYIELKFLNLRSAKRQLTG